MSVPPGDGGEKKFNWASELSTVENPGKPRVFRGFFVLALFTPGSPELPETDSKCPSRSGSGATVGATVAEVPGRNFSDSTAAAVPVKRLLRDRGAFRRA